MAARIRKGDRVAVLTGKDRNSQGTVLAVDHARDRVTVEGVNVVKRHQRPTAKLGRGGIVQREAPIHISNVVLLHRGERTRVGFQMLDGKKVRWSKRHNEAIDG
jgi:large subunit ribosomal protein L24